MLRQNIQKTFLPNGITIITDKMLNVHSTAIGVWIPRGSRHESKEENGLSHFYEHLVFKGTKKRTAFEIASAIEDRGGLLEAYTTRQETGFYAQVIPSDTFLALEVISDMLMHPLFSLEDFEKERKVIIEEIHSYADIAEELAADLFYDTHYKNSGLALPIAGSVSSVKKLTLEKLLEYKKQVQSEIPLVICAAGKLEHDSIVKKCQELFAEKVYCKTLPTNYTANASVKYKSKQDLSQSSLVFGTSFPFEKLTSEFKYALSLFNVAFGSGMSSRIFQKVREEYGLAYSVYSTTDVYSDCFGFSVSLAAEHHKIKKAFHLIKEELRQFLENGFRTGESKRAKKNILGSMEIGFDNPEKRLLRLAEHYLHFGKIDSMEEVKNQFRQITDKQVLDLLQETFFNAPWSLALVHGKNEEKIPLDCKI